MSFFFKIHISKRAHLIVVWQHITSPEQHNNLQFIAEGNLIG